MGERAGAAVEMTVLFTDIEGSTRLWDEYPSAAAGVLDHHDALLGEAIAARGGALVGHTGDGLIGRFDDPTSAAGAALDIQRALRDADWGDVGAVQVRIGIHTGDVIERADGLFGWALNYCSRIMDVGHGGQVLVSTAASAGLDLGALDGADLVDLGEQGLRDLPGRTRLHQLVAPDLPAQFPPLRKTASSGRSVPRGRGPLFGRDRDLAELLEAAEAYPLVTLTGPPGVGKTRLAIEAARSIAGEQGPVEVLWSELTGIAPDAVVASIMSAHSISLRPDSSVIDSLVAWLSERRVVLVLDGCDGSLEVVADLALAIVGRAPSAAVIATSQRTLGVADETVLRLAPLDRSAATALFLDRAAAGGARDVGGEIAGKIVGLLDDLPYAIEIAAANTAVFSPEAVFNALIDSGLDGVATDDERVIAVRQAVGLAIDALEPAARRCLMAATVFTGPFDARGFRSVCDPVGGSELSGRMTELVESSLLQPITLDGHAMYRLIDPVRSALDERLDRDVVLEAQERLLDHVVELVRDAAAGLRGPSEPLWLRVLGRHFGEIRNVFLRCVDDGDIATSAFLASELWEWAFFRFNSEYFGWGSTLLERADTADTADSATLAPVHGVVALGCWFRDEIGPTRQHADEAIRRERSVDAPFSLPARLALINAAVFAGAESPPADVFADSDDYHRSSPDAYFRMNAEAQNAIMATWLGNHEAAEHLALKALKIARRSGNPTALAYAQWVLGQAIEHDDTERAEQLFDDALRLARDVENRWIVSLVQVSLASSRRRSSGPLASAGLLADLLGQLRRAGHWAQLWNVMRLVALCAGDLGRDEVAYQLATAVDGADLKFPALPVDAQALAEMVAAIEERRGASWSRRTAAIASTWGHDDVVAAGSAELAAMLERA